jgi:tRNA wybutosine-synthesizing protein 2
MSSSVRIAVVAPRENVKAVKQWLETRGWFAKSIERLNDNPTTTTSFRIATTLSATTPELLELPHVCECALTTVAAPPPSPPVIADPLQAFLHAARLPADLRATAPKRSSTYPPLLLLPSDAFASAPWRAYLREQPEFLADLATALKVSHIARNAPIAAGGNVMRSPSGLEFLYPPDYSSSPDAGFGGALWVHTTQNGIRQTWAPEFTMFSRGNVKEKKRVLEFKDVRGQEVVDLFAGIGYFVFSYLKAGATRVWCWEINPWSVEALRRGCAENGWSVRVVKRGEEFVDDAEEKVVVFEESNEHAVHRMKGRSTRVRHVNLGLLPSSRNAWEAALTLLQDGGCAHVHENVGEQEVKWKREEFVRELQGIEEAAGRARLICCEHVERVKTFAPGVLHCVFDMRVGALVNSPS